MEETREISQIDFEKIHPKYLKALEGVSDKIRNEVHELVTSIPFIYNLVRKDRKKVSDLPKDKNGKVIVNITEPHLLENTDYFRERAIFYQNNGKYTDIYPNSHPNSEWMKFWTEESRKCLEGVVREDGEWITGEHYWYLNYCPILVAQSDATDAGENVYAVRTEAFPEFWDGDYLYYHYRYQARQKGLHCNVLKTRRRGYSYKGASVLTLPYYHMRNQKSYAMASEGEFLYVDGLLNDKTWNMMSFIDNNTPWTQPRDYKDTTEHKRASYKDPSTKTERGRLNEIIGVTLKNNTQKARGKAGINILWEEYGVMPEGLTSWTIALGSMKQGRKVYGQMTAFGTGGCLTGNNKVWTNEGNLVNIKDLEISKGIIGYKKDIGFSKEEITYWQKPTKKECLYIETNSGRWIECSIDHPIYSAIMNKSRRIKENKFIEAEKLNIGDYIATIEDVNIWSNKELKEARVIGWLIGDGTYGYDNSVRIANCEEEIISYLENNYDCRTQLERKTKLGKTYKEIRIKGYCKVLRELGIYGQTKLKKTLPNDIHSYSKESVCNFLGGLYDTDGYISFRKNPRRESYLSEISISQASKPLLLEIQLLLQKLGIHAGIRTRQPRLNNPKDKNEWYELNIRDCRSLILFAENIKIFVTEKQNRLNKILEYEKTKKPHKVYKGLRYEKVVKIKNTGNQDVYNLTANNTNTYIGNGIITHNTAGEAFEAMETLFYKGDSYDIYMLPNVYDKGANGSLCAFYSGEYMNREFCYDKIGNSDPIKALVEIVTEWKTKDALAIVQFKADYSITPQDACLRKEGSIFPVVDLKEYLSSIIPNYRSFISEHTIGSLVLNTYGNVEWSLETRYNPIHEFPIKDNKNKQGCIEIFKPPVKLNNESIPFGRYIAGCLTPGEQVMTDKGLMNVEEVSLQEKLINKEGDLVSIHNLQRYNVTDESIYKVKVSNTFRTTTFTKEHPIYVSNDINGYISQKKCKKENLPQRYKKLDFKFEKAENINIGQWIKVPNIYKKEKLEIPSFVIKNSSLECCNEFWWLIGLWLGDGWCTNGKVSVVINKQEVDYTDKLIYIIENLFIKKAQVRERKGCYEITFSDKEFCKYLTDNFGKGAENKYLTEWVKYIPSILKQQLLLGYLASDGCIYKSKNNLYSTEFVSISLKLLEGIQDILFALDIVSNLSLLRPEGISTIEGRKCMTKETYHLRLGHNETLKFAEENKWTDDYKLSKIDWNNLKENKRKLPNRGCFIDKENIYFKITEIEKSEYTGIVYNFECDTHTFMCHHITTHNCDPFDDDASSTNSLGSLFIMDLFTDEIVCEYTGRPNTAEEFYSNVYKVLKYYNATCLYESFNKGLFGYMDKKRALHLLADNPKILKQMDYIKGDFHGNKSKGYPPSKPVNSWGRRLYADWLVSAPLIKDEENPDLCNLHKVRSIGLIRESIGWNSDGNFDRVSALQALMIYREERSKYNIDIQEEEVDVDDFFIRNYKPMREKYMKLKTKKDTQ